MFLSVLLFVSFGVFTNGIVIDDECGKTKFCVYFPSGCDAANPNTCTKFASWKQENVTAKTIQMELRGDTGSFQTPYIAFAFGTSNQMKDADMYACHENGIVTGVIKAHYATPIKSVYNGLRTDENGKANGVVHCKFSRPLSVSKTISGDVSKDFNLESETYYILMARGLFENDFVTKHDSAVASTTKTNFTMGIDSTPIDTTPSVTIPTNQVTVKVTAADETGTGTVTEPQDETTTSAAVQNTSAEILFGLFLLLSLLWNLKE